MWCMGSGMKLSSEKGSGGSRRCFVARCRLGTISVVQTPPQSGSHPVTFYLVGTLVGDCFTDAPLPFLPLLPSGCHTLLPTGLRRIKTVVDEARAHAISALSTSQPRCGRYEELQSALMFPVRSESLSPVCFPRRQFLGTPPTCSDAFQLPPPPTSSAPFFTATRGSPTNCQPQSPIEAALLALDTPMARVSPYSIASSSPSLGPLQKRGIGMGHMHAPADVPRASEGPVLAMGMRSQMEGQLGLAGLAENRSRRGDHPQSGPPLVYIPGQGASLGAWYVLEPVDLAHPERTPQISIPASPASVAERIRKALVDHTGGPPEVNRPPTSEVHGSLLGQLNEPLSPAEQANILEQLQWQQQQDEDGVALAALAATFQDEGPNRGGRSAAEPLAPATWGFPPSMGKQR
jgi:hypothetical protein